MISFIIPTRNRADMLRRTIDRLDAICAELRRKGETAEAIIIDNASATRPALPKKLASGTGLREIYLDENIGAAARNHGASEAEGDWLIMLDDDSIPLDAEFLRALEDAPEDVAAIGSEILLPDGKHEAGGLPEVITGCGAAIRRQAFLDAGGYDQTLEYYVEEYDLCAKLIQQHWRVTHDRRFRVLHQKVQTGRDFNQIIRRLVRNNCWVMQRYAPEPQRNKWLQHTINRYGDIARREGAEAGFAQGMRELESTLEMQTRRPLTPQEFDRFTGLSAIRSALPEALGDARTAALIERGKNTHVIEQALRELDVDLAPPEHADRLIIGTLAPGPMLDGAARRQNMGDDRRVVMPWDFGHGARVTLASSAL